MVVLSAPERAALQDFCGRVRERFGDRVHKLALFGSRATGKDVHDESDIDVCVVIDDLLWQEKHEVYGMTGSVLEDHDV